MTRQSKAEDHELCHYGLEATGYSAELEPLEKVGD